MNNFTRVLFVLLLAALFLGGCAFGKAMDRADAHMQAGEWGDALKAYKQANKIDPEDPDALTGMEAARRKLIEVRLADARQALDKKDYAAAYEATASARKARTDQTDIDLFVNELRTSALADAEAAIEAESFNKGLGLLDTIVRFEPGQAEALAPRIKAAESTWAASLSAQAAKDDKAGHVGPALVRHAMAAALTGDEANVKARNKLRADLFRLNTFRIALEIKGDRAQKDVVRSKLSDTLLTDGRGIRVTDTPTEPGIRLSAEIAKAKCTQASVSRKATHRYVSGTRQVPNPDYQRAEKGFRDAEEALEEAEREEASRRDALERAKKALEGASGDEKLKKDVAAATERFDDASKETRDTRRTMRSARDERDRLPKTLTEDVYSEFLYDVLDWTRTCKVTWKGQIAGVEGENPVPFEDAADAETKDEAHAAFRRFEIARDPLAFPKTDAVLTEQIDGDIASSLAGRASRSFDTHRAGLLARAEAIAQSEPEESVRLLVLAYLLDPKAEGPAAKLKESFEMRDVGVLLSK